MIGILDGMANFMGCNRNRSYCSFIIDFRREIDRIGLRVIMIAEKSSLTDLNLYIL
jgi:hypothetical protein